MEVAQERLPSTDRRVRDVVARVKYNIVEMESSVDQKNVTLRLGLVVVLERSYLLERPVTDVPLLVRFCIVVMVSSLLEKLAIPQPRLMDVRTPS